MRAFAAIELPDAFRDEVASVARQLSAAIEARYLPRQNYHITLAFLGDILEGQLHSAMEALDEATDSIGPVCLKPDGIGKFGRPQNATLWMGLAKDPEMIALADRLRGGLRMRGIDFDDKPFKPHITLSRHAKIPYAELPQLLFPQEAVANRVALLKSTLSRDGATYKPLHEVEIEL